MFEIVGAHALVTGGGRGIGLAIARTLTARGAKVTILGRDEDSLHAAVASGAAARHVCADVTDEAAVTGAIDRCQQAWGPLSVVINNAGGADAAPIARLDRAAWDQCILLNLTSVYIVSRHVLPSMVRAGAGRLVNIASTAGLKGYPSVAAYCAAKHGVVGLTRALAAETAKTAVTVNAVCPGYTETDLVQRSAAAVSARTGRDPAQVRQLYASASPQGRLMQPEEVAEAVAFLCGPNSGAMTGQAIAVAGGEVG